MPPTCSPDRALDTSDSLTSTWSAEQPQSARGSGWERQGKAEEGGEGSGGGGAMRKWCVVCALEYYVDEASKIWEVVRKLVGSSQEVATSEVLCQLLLDS